MDLSVMNARRAFRGLALPAVHVVPHVDFHASAARGEAVAFDVNGWTTIVTTMRDPVSTPLSSEHVAPYLSRCPFSFPAENAAEILLQDRDGQRWVFDRQRAVLEELATEDLLDVARWVGKRAARRLANQRVTHRLNRLIAWMAGDWTYLMIQVQKLDGFGAPHQIQSASGIASDLDRVALRSIVEDLVEGCFPNTRLIVRRLPFV